MDLELLFSLQIVIHQSGGLVKIDIVYHISNQTPTSDFDGTSKTNSL